MRKFPLTSEILKLGPSSSSTSKHEYEKVLAVHSPDIQLPYSSYANEENSEDSTDSSSSPLAFQYDYDVFLSFRGDDTRKNFTDHLYNALNQKGISTFRDAESLRKGDAIKPKLLKAIKKSRFAVVIFSKDYASSMWCLDELRHIVNCRILEKLKVYPVFYDVKPSEVRNQTGSFGDAFAKHEAFENHWTRKRWRYALKEIANISGWDLHERNESSVIQDITREISNILNFHSFLFANKDLVGMSKAMNKMMSYLYTGSLDVRMIGIWGMGGIGKTTLAQEVFKRVRDEFDASAFVANVREECGKANGLLYLQRLLYGMLQDNNESICIQNVDMGINLLRRRFLMKKVLIILDDVNDLRQIQALAAGMINAHNSTPPLGPGSRVIITTRDEHLLKAYRVHNIYEVGTLNKYAASELFCLNAFKQIYAPKEYRRLSDKIVKYAGGFPLALEVLGSNLFGRNKGEWSAAYARLDHEGPGKDILGVLQTSFDGLEDTEKKIFLDIACFFKGEDQARVKKVFESCGFYPEIGISVLIEKSLIRIERNKLWMHDLLQQLACRIVHQEAPREAGKRSRLWMNKNDPHTRRCSWLDEVLTENTGTHAVESIYLSLPKKQKIHFTADPFRNMSNLLKICNVDISGSLKYLSRKLRVLEWHEFHLESLPASFQPEQLVEHELIELKMPNSRIKHLWNGRLSLNMLLLIDLSYCRWLTRTPDFSNVPNLEELILEGCGKLSELHPTIWGLQKLVVLNLNSCVSLESLPDAISLTSLRALTLSGCSKLKEFPKIVKNMESLLEFHMERTAIEELPEAIQHFSGLTVLNLRGCENLSNLPNALCGLASLQQLYLSGCPRIDRLPRNLGSLQHLEEIDFSETSITTLPSSFSLLKNLKRFRGSKLISSDV